MARTTTRWGAAVLVAATCSLLLAATPAQATDPPPNSGRPGSRCEARQLGQHYTKPGPGVRASGLGPNPPAYYEVGQPTGANAAAQPNGVMMIIHGGAWFVVGRDSVSNVRRYTDSWRERGWVTVNIDYGACARSVDDVVWFFDRIRAIYQSTVCASGISAGGHLALMLAALRPELACVIGLGAPSDLLPLEREQPKLFNLAVAAFGASHRLAQRSPITHVGRVHARVLLASAKADRRVPPSQNASYARALRRARPGHYVDVRSLESGPHPFVHAGVSVRAWREFQAAEDALVAPWSQPLVTAQRVE